MFFSTPLENHGQPCHFKYICVEALCSTRRLKLIEYRAFLARAKAEQQPSRVIHQLACFDLDRAVQCPNLSRKKSCFGRDQWLVLPHYPLLVKAGLSHTLNSFWASSFATQCFRTVFKVDIKVRISWRVNHNVYSLIRKSSRNLAGRNN